VVVLLVLAGARAVIVVVMVVVGPVGVAKRHLSGVEFTVHRFEACDLKLCSDFTYCRAMLSQPGAAQVLQTAWQFGPLFVEKPP
jgi:hypothetical protein